MTRPAAAATADTGLPLLEEKARAAATPIWLIRDDGGKPPAEFARPEIKAWLDALRWKPQARKTAQVPGEGGGLGGIAFGLGSGLAGDPSGPSELLVGQLAQALPPGGYRLEGAIGDGELAAIAWGLGAYRFRRYKAGKSESAPRLALPEGADGPRVANTIEAVWLGRDLINTPAGDMGPAELEVAARGLAARHGATVTSVIGDDLLAKNFPMIHAVGRASPKAPRLVDIRWQKKGGAKTARTVTLIGKGITFDTGGLDIKPPSAMLIMKKDMGGAATALTLAHMIMGQGLDVKLRVLLAVAENAISGDAFRPGDILTSRAGTTVEIGNTDAEGRLVLADALALADEEAPDDLFVFATLTGAARSALGPELPALFTDDDELAADLVRTGVAVGDPLWRLPFWPGYERHLDSDVADMNNVWESPFAGAITAALFLKKFVRNARRFAHFDLYGWRPQARPLGPKGGEPQTARAVMAQLSRELSQ